jgi:HSP20 family protein
MNPSSLLPWNRNKVGRRSRRNEDDGFFALQTGVNRAFDAFWRGFNAPVFASWDQDLSESPALNVDLKDTEREVVVTAELPGMEEDDVEVSLAGGVLTIRAEKETERESDNGGYIIRERSVGAIERAVPLPDGLDLDTAQATLTNGLLTIRIPKQAAAKGSAKRVTVQRG